MSRPNWLLALILIGLFSLILCGHNGTIISILAMVVAGIMGYNLKELSGRRKR